MNKKTFFLSLLLTFPAFCFAVVPLIPTDKQELAKGGMIKKVVWKDGFIWPEVTILVVLNHSPLDNLNVFLDFDSHKTYVPDMLESKVIKKVSPTQTQVYFEMEMPWPVKKTTHVTNNVVSSSSDGSYTLKWNLVKADMLKATDGHMSFYPYEGKTLLEYVSLIVPNSSLAGMFKDRVASDVEKSVVKITKHLNKTLNNRDTLLSTSQKSQPQSSL
jgi:hypothetical protein